jgi:uncharacterized membrane protein
VATPSSRIEYLDWARGMACLLMFQTHAYDAWLDDVARQTSFFQWTRHAGSLPAPLFLFLAGMAVALLCERAIQKGASARQAARIPIRRGGQIFALALLFRLQEFLLGQPNAPWTDLLRVDVLNIIGLSLVLLGLLVAAMWRSWDAPRAPQVDTVALASRLRLRAALAAVAIAAIIAVATPPMWTTIRPRWLPWFLESYINGVHIFDRPQAYLFAIFPWVAFAFGGFAAGCLLASPWARRRSLESIGVIAAGGASLFALAMWLDSRPQLYAVYDYWHTSPNYFMARTAIVAAVLVIGYFWCRWAPALWEFSPVVELGKQSLLVYWISIELTYGGLSIVRKHAQTIPSATVALLALTTGMVVLAAIRNRARGRPLREWLSLRRAPTRAAA